MRPLTWQPALLLLALCAGAESASAQGPTVVTGGGFVPGGQVLFATDFSQDRVGNFPSGLKYVRGPMEVVLVDGVPMLRSMGPAEFIIPLAAPLPQDFTLEFDFVSRNSNCCSGEELAFEGSPQLNRSTGSAWVSWHHQGTGIIGGGQDLGSSTVRFPEDLQGELKGQLGQIQVMMSGTQFKLYTNGRQIYNIPNLVFRRTNLLRVYLGGRDDGTAAVYLARVRLAGGGGGAGVVAVNPPPTTVSQSSASTGTTNPTLVPTAPAAVNSPVRAALSVTVLNVTVTMGPAGPVVTWAPVPGSLGYTVDRWKIDDLKCCNNSSGTYGVSGISWQDTPLPVFGTYVYQVTSAKGSGPLPGQGQTQFVYQAPFTILPAKPPTASATPIVAPPPPPPAAPTCACTQTGPFAAPDINTITGSGLTGSFAHPTDGTFTVTAQSVGGSVMLDVHDSQNRSVLSVTNPAAWGISSDGRYFAVAVPPFSINTGAPMSVHRVARGPSKWPIVVNTVAWPDGRWGFSADGSLFVITRFENAPIQFSVEAFSLKATTPSSAALRRSETNVYGPTVTVSPCGDRLMYFRWTQLGPQTGQGDFYARKDFGSSPSAVITDWDNVSPATPTASTIAGSSSSSFLVQLSGLKVRSTGKTSFSSLQCTIP